MRFQIRPSHSAVGITVYCVYDTHGHRLIDAYSRPQIAEMAVARLNREHEAHLARARAVAS